MEIKDYGELKFLKSLDEYRTELLSLYHEVGVGIETNTLVSSDLDLIRRWEELVIIISFLEGRLKDD